MLFGRSRVESDRWVAFRSHYAGVAESSLELESASFSCFAAQAGCGPGRFESAGFLATHVSQVCRHPNGDSRTRQAFAGGAGGLLAQILWRRSLASASAAGGTVNWMQQRRKVGRDQFTRLSRVAMAEVVPSPPRRWSAEEWATLCWGHWPRDMDNKWPCSSRVTAAPIGVPATRMRHCLTKPSSTTSCSGLPHRRLDTVAVHGTGIATVRRTRGRLPHNRPPGRWPRRRQSRACSRTWARSRAGRAGRR